METERITIDDQDIEVDPRTGEILDVGRPGIDGTKAEQLSQIARWLDGRNECLDHLDKPRPDCVCKDCMQGRELEHIISRMEVLASLQVQRKERLNERIGQLVEWAKQLMDDMGEEKVKIPGIGRFGYRKGKESVDTTEYDKKEDDLQEMLQGAFKDLFTFKTSPNKEAIKEAKGDNRNTDLSECGFTLKRPNPKFSFTPEK